MMDIPAGWTPGEYKPSIDPMLETTIDDIKNDDKTRKEYIDLIVEKLKTVYDPEISIDIYNLGLIYAKGDGVRINMNKAKKLFLKACDGGVSQGCKYYELSKKHGAS